MRLNDDHACLAIEHLLISVLEVVVDLQVEVVQFVKVADDTDEITGFDPELNGPAPPE